MTSIYDILNVRDSKENMEKEDLIEYATQLEDAIDEVQEELRLLSSKIY